MACKLCAWLLGRFAPNCDPVRDSITDASSAWERAESNDYELWCEQPARARRLAEKALAAQDSDPEAAFRMHLEAADAGSVWAMEVVASCYHRGTAAEADFIRAQDYYYRALCGGSWMATIGYARLLAGQGYFEQCEEVLEDGVQNDFIPAYFWLAWYRYRRNQTAETCREIRPLLEVAAGRGHPEAELMLARLMARGRLGLRDIPKGLGRLLEMAGKFPPKQMENVAA